jgi:diguanylate cyclase (GGDEF)-like protein/PAS domain S-box-containing protein
VAAVGAVLGLVRFRTRRLEEQQHRLEETVRERTAELQQEKERVEEVNLELERLNAELGATNSELETLSMVTRETDNAVITADPECVIDWVNTGFTRLTGYTLDEIRENRGATLMDVSSHPDIADLIGRAVREKRSFIYEATETAKDGSELWLSSTLTPIFDHGGQLRKLVIIATNITRLKKIEEALRESEERYALAARGANDGLWDWNLSINEIYFGPRWKHMLGYEDHELRNTPNTWFDRVHPDDMDRLEADLAAHMEGKTSQLENEHRILHRDGAYRWMLCRGIAVLDRDGRAYRMVGSLTDITERRVFDALTGLPNRTLLMARLNHTLEVAARRRDYLFAVLALGIDRSKVVVASSAGDELLLAAAQRLRKCLSPDDTIARISADELTVLLDDIMDVSEAVRTADRIVTAFSVPFTLGDHEMVAPASVGIALSTTGYERAEDVVRDADTAMLRARSGGKSRYELFDATMRDHLVARLDLETDLRRALERSELRLHYQPIVSLGDGSIVGFEALARWQHPERGLLEPTQFIPLAEETGLIVPLGQWVLAEACRQTRAWQEQHAGTNHTMISVNLSGAQLSEPDLPEYVRDSLESAALDPRHLQLEITESVIIDSSEPVSEVLDRLKDLCVMLAIDDFGTGYSSLSYLHRFPFDTLKIDRTFVARLGTHDGKAEIVGTLVSLAENLGMKVVAEGIETARQLDHLKALECELGQGFLFSTPVDADTAGGLLSSPPRW